MDRSSQGVYVWFFPRYDADVPPAVQYGNATIDPSTIAKMPDAVFQWDDCDYPSHFNEHQIVFDLTFCVSCIYFAYSECLIGLIFLPNRVIGLGPRSHCPPQVVVQARVAIVSQRSLKADKSLTPPLQLSTTTQRRLRKLIGRSILFEFTPHLHNASVRIDSSRNFSLYTHRQSALPRTVCGDPFSS